MCDPLPLDGQPMISSAKVGRKDCQQPHTNFSPEASPRQHPESSHKRREFFRGSLQLPSAVIVTVKGFSHWWNRVMASIKSLF